MKRLACTTIPVALFALAAACGPSGGNNVPDCDAALLAGDLVITEVLANPDGDDEGNEWFEIYNATGAAINLEGVRLIASREDGTSEDEHVMSELVLGPGEYAALGGVLPEFAPAHVDYGYGGDLGSLLNSAGRLAIACDVVEVDEVIYSEMSSGLAQGLDGAISPDYLANDNRDNWCEATMGYDATENLGSPGEANETCGVVSPDECDDGGTMRPINAPAAGDLTITEIMPNPAAVGDTDGEWIEVLVTASAEIDLNGVNLGRDVGSPTTTISDPACITAQPGDYIVFAKTLDSAVNGMLPQADYEFDFSLINSDGAMFIGHATTVLDQITWSSSSSGSSLGVDPDFADPTGNDDENVWCDEAATTYGAGDFGTPGTQNSECDIPPPAGMCYEGKTLRAINKPVIGDVTITEIMPNPAAVGDTAGEYFEVHFAQAADLNELQFGRTSFDETILPAACIPIAADTYVVFAVNDDMVTNGGIPLVSWEMPFGLSQSAGTDYPLQVGIDDTVFDMTSYNGSDISSGISRQYDMVNDLWCDTPDGITYGDGDRGSPTLANESCLP